MTKPELIKLTTAAEVTPTEIEHEFVRVEHAHRIDALIALVEEEDPERAIIFVRTRHETKRLAQKLDRLAGLQAGYLNGDMSQNARNTMMSRFRSGELKYLIATDVAARGLDIEGLTHVFHFAVPTVVETYIHRSGRTGRAGAEGKTITLVTPEGEEDFAAIRKKITFVERPFDASTLPDRLAPVPQAPKGARQQAPRELTSRVPAAPARPMAEEVAIPGLDDRPAKPARGHGVSTAPAEQAPARASRARARDTGTLTVDAPRPARKDGEGRRRRELPPSATNPTRDASELLNGSTGELRLATGPLAPLPRHAVSWRKYKLALATGHRHTRDSMHDWLSKRTGVARSAMRSIAIFADHVTVEVDERHGDRFLAGLKSAK
jgi:superfamily II DNA/RNA helicase